jgi:tetratricopeptide (TPR) repeat protein
MRNWVLLSAGNLEDARKGIAGGLARSKAPEFMLQDGVLKISQRDFAGGRASLEELLKEKPDDFRALQALANSYFAEKKDAAGLAIVRLHAGQNPNSALFQSYLGQLLLFSGDRPGARAAFEAAQKADPTYQPSEVGLAMLDSAEGKLDSARQTLRRLTGQKNPNSLAALRLGMLEEAAKNYGPAADAYKIAVEARPTDWVPLNNLANVLMALGRYNEALQYAQHAKELAPANPLVTDTIGWAFYNMKMYGAAVQQLETLKNDKSADSRYRLAMAYFKNGDIAQGQSTLANAAKLDPANPQAAMAQQVAEEATATKTR